MTPRSLADTPHRSRRRWRRTTAALGAALLVFAACGSDEASRPATTAAGVSVDSASSAADTTAASESTAGADATAVPDTSGAADTTVPSDATAPADTADTTDTTAASADGEYAVQTLGGDTVALDAQPVRIISLAPTHTESLFAIGAGDQVIAVDDQSNFPADTDAVRTTLSGFTPNIEAIAGYSPDLVVIGDDYDGLGEQLRALDIPVWSGPAAATLDDVYAEIEQLGVLTGHVAEAAELVANMQSDVSSILAELPESETPPTYYHELDSTLYSVTSATFIGQLYSLAGLQNIADEGNADTPYPQLSAEHVISADPQLIFLADTKCCGETPDTVAARDGWADISAVRNGAVIAMDDDIASRWGPRVVDYLRAIVDAVVAVSRVSPS